MREATMREIDGKTALPFSDGMDVGGRRGRERKGSLGLLAALLTQRKIGGWDGTHKGPQIFFYGDYQF